MDWKSFCKPRKCGGLGIKPLALMNQALLGKWFGGFQKKGTPYGLRLYLLSMGYLEVVRSPVGLLISFLAYGGVLCWLRTILMPM